MEEKKDQLPEGGVQDRMNLKEMDLYELKNMVCALAERRQRNEKNVPEELLTTKYAKAYESLCEELKFARGEMVSKYNRIIRELYEIMTDDAYGEEPMPETQDPFAWALYLTFKSYINGDWTQYADVLKMYRDYSQILLEDDPSWKVLTERAEAMIKEPGCTEIKQQLILYTVAELERIAKKRSGR